VVYRSPGDGVSIRWAPNPCTNREPGHRHSLYYFLEVVTTPLVCRYCAAANSRIYPPYTTVTLLVG
jgi:hypothetical protein